MRKIFAVVNCLCGVMMLVIVIVLIIHQSQFRIDLRSSQSEAQNETQISSTIALAQAKEQEAELIIQKGRELGLTCLIDSENCAKIITRADNNPQLKQALLRVKTAGVRVHPKDWLQLGLYAGRVGQGFVQVNVNISDERIIAFLTN